jgi:hypothetical protein
MLGWFERLGALGGAGCHLVTVHEIRPGVAFFERLGFRRHGPAQLLPAMRMPDGARMHQQVMVRDVESSG